MRKITTALIALLMMAVFTPGAHALDPDKCGKARGRFTNIGFVYNHLSQEGMPKLHSDMGFNFTKGNTYYLHKPIAGCLRFGIDAAWIDLSYDNYKVEYAIPGNLPSYDYDPDDWKFDIHHLDLGMQIGASATVNLFKRFQANAYFRYNPGLALMYNNEEAQVGFANMFNTGIAVTYARVGLGIEARFGKSKMKSYFADDDYDYGYDDDYGDWSDAIGSRKVKTKFSGLRAYITFRF